MKKILAAAIAAALTLTMSGCLSVQVDNAMTEYNFAEMDAELIQLKPPNEGDTIAVIDTDYGEIRTVLYEQYAPNTVAAFIKNAESGVYDNIPVYGVINDIYFLTGGHEDERGFYTGRTSDDELIENECSVNLWPFKGALMSFSEQNGKSDSRWFICDNDKESNTEDAIGKLKESAAEREDEKERENLLNLFDKFYEVGGVFGLAGTVTVFGQTYEGMDVAEKLCDIPADEHGRPSVDVMIKSVKIMKYGEEENED